MRWLKLFENLKSWFLGAEKFAEAEDEESFDSFLDDWNQILAKSSEELFVLDWT